LILVDLVNPFDFPEGCALLRHARAMVGNVAKLRAKARRAGVPCIYVNDNFDCWHLGFRELVERVRRRSAPGRAVLDRIEPDPSADYFVLKPMHSGFYGTALDVLLRRLRVRRLILAGLAGDICVFLTASDAYMRGFELAVPADCVASEDARSNARALRDMERLLKADVRPSRRLRLRAQPSGTLRSRRGSSDST
jgi:nicotinamidase-related amidase